MRAIVIHQAGGPEVLKLVAWAALADANLKAGDTLLVQAGSSGTGQATVDIG